MKKFLEILRTAFTWALVLLALCMTVFTVVSLKTVDAADRNLFGYKAFIVQSDSMAATDFSAGDVILVQETDPASLREGDIISFISRNSHNFGETVTHKIRSLTTDPGGNPGFVTYGTSTGSDDESIVLYEDVLGKYILAIPQVGSFFALLRTPKGYISFILIPFLLVIAYTAFNVVHLFTLARKEAEREKEALIRAEQEKNEALQRELAQLRKMVLQGQQRRPQQPGVPQQRPQQPKPQQPAPQQPKPQQAAPARPAPRKPADYDELDLENIMAEFRPRRDK